MAGDGMSFSNVRLLLHGDGSDGATTITDSSQYNRTFTVQGGAQIDTAESVFGGSSLYLPGDIYGFTTPSDSTLDMRTGAFQVDWRYMNESNLDPSQPDTIIAMVDGSSWAFEWAVVVDSVGLRFYYGTRGVSNAHIQFMFPPGIDLSATSGTWFAFSIARDSSGDWAAWVDGVRCTDYRVSPLQTGFGYGSIITGTYNNMSDFGDSTGRTLNIGRFHTFGGLAVNKHIDELRYVTGQSRNISTDYTPFATAFPS